MTIRARLMTVDDAQPVSRHGSSCRSIYPRQGVPCHRGGRRTRRLLPCGSIPNERHILAGRHRVRPYASSRWRTSRLMSRLIAHIGPGALAVTTNLNINFLRKPGAGPLECTCRILKLGKRLPVSTQLSSTVGRRRPRGACHSDLFDPAEA